MKQKFDNFYFLLGWLGIFVCLSGIEPALAETNILANFAAKNRQLDNRQTESYSISAQDLLAQENAPASLVRVTGIELEQTDNGLEIIFQTPTGQQLVPSIRPEGNNLAIDISDAILALPTGNQFRETNPIPGVTEISVVQVDGSNIRVTIAGEKQAPSAEVMRSQENLVLNVTPEASTAQSQPANVAPEASTTQSQPDEEVEIVVTGEGEDNDYFAPNATSATRTDTPILDTPQSVQVVPQKVLED